MLELWLIRHGQSESNANMPTYKTAEVKLTPRGEYEATQIPAAFDKAPSLLVTSSYRRAQQTAIPTQERFPEVPLEEWPIHEFTYIDEERCRGMNLDQRGPIVQEYWERADPYWRDGPEVESFVEFMERLDRFWEQVFALHEKGEHRFVAVFCHGHVIRGILWRLLVRPQPWVSEWDSLMVHRFRAFFQSVFVPNGAILPLSIKGPGAIHFAPFLLEHLTQHE